MFYQNNIKGKTYKSKTVVFDLFGENINADVETIKNGQGVMCYNFENKSGALETGIGFGSLSLPVADGSSVQRDIIIFNETDILKLWHYKYYDHINKLEIDKVMFFNVDGRLSIFNVFTYDDYSYIINNNPEIFATVPAGINYCIDGEDYMIFSGEGGLYAYSQHMLPVLNENCQKALSICRIYDNIFIIPNDDRGSVLFTSNINPLELGTSFSEMDLTGDGGRLCALINFDDYLFIFRDYGITKLSKYGSSDNFSTSEIYRSATKIFAETVVVCGDMIVFLTQDGIYKFNGSSTIKFDLKIECLLENSNNKFATACYFKGKYYLACRLNFNDNESVGCENYINGFKNNAIIILDVKSDKFNITRGVDIASLLSLNAGSLNTILTSFYGEFANKIGVLNDSGKVFDLELSSIWKSASIDFDEPDKLKIIRKILIKSDYDCTLTLKSDLEEKIVNIIGQNKTVRLNSNIKGTSFEILISSLGNAKISSLVLSVDIFE